MSDWIGKWYLYIWKSPIRVIDISIGEQNAITNDIYIVNNYKFWKFNLTIVKPTIKYINRRV